ncbi:hypothetical protein OOT55_17680 [Marinimicrobium sp. C6131]|uniref:hypothetical protein n=1 Tax=Marinimicrobium sp. C6131 TaxID=3022676 RepID=UPI00223E7D0B|nr:hypothetical protein [Marinimicrobium sp. C6131]UZJ44464.1 hypothetical protein OOT55_17680 [Marinimicrobium sp. C6131]
MRILKIDGNNGHYSINGDDFESIDKLDKERLLKLVDLALTKEVEMDEYDPEILKNEAHRIIYRSVHKKLRELVLRKDEFFDKSEREFYETYENYKNS